MLSHHLRRGLLALLVPLTLGLHGCGPMPPAEPGIDPAAAEPTPRPTVAPTETTQPTAAPTATPAPTQPPVALPDEPPARAELRAAVGAYLAAGGDVAALEERLRAWGAYAEEQGGFWAGLDLNGDAHGDIVLTARDVGGEGVPALIPTGILLAYLGDERGYAETLYVDEEGLPAVQAIVDLTGDGQDDLLYAATNCGAHTCFGDLQGYRWQCAEALPLFSDAVDHPFPGYAVEDVDGDGLREVLVETGTIGSVGAGPQRTYRLVYGWDGSALALEDETVTSGEHPIHLLNDADALLEGGAYVEAIALYERSYTDPDLDRSASWAEEGWEVALEAYARYRQVLAWTLAGDRDAAAETYETLLADLGEDPNAERYLDLARTFWGALEAGDVDGACRAVRERAGEMEWGVDVPLNAFGYTNRTYGPDDMCPAAPAEG